MKMNKVERVQWIDKARGIGIILVVVGHMLIPQILESWIVSFHMPLFLAGCTFNTNTEFGVFERKRVKTLLVPYFALGISLAPYWIACMGEVDYLEEFLKYIRTLLLGVSYGHLWFIPCLFITNVLYYLITSITRNLPYSMIVKGVCVFTVI